MPRKNELAGAFSMTGVSAISLPQKKMGSLHLSHRNLDPAAYNPIGHYVSMRCRMLRVDEDTFTMISGLIVIAVICIAGLLALGA